MISPLTEITQRLHQIQDYSLPDWLQLLRNLYGQISILRGVEIRRERNFDADRFRKWLANNGVCMESLDFRFIEGAGFGVISKRTIREGDLLVQINDNLSISSAKLDDKLSQIVLSDPILASFPQLVLIIRLLQECQREDSFWVPYIKTLPTDINLPILYSLAEIEQLRGLSIVAEIIKEIFNGIKQFEVLSRLNERHKLFQYPLKYKDFEWARSVCLSRQNPIVVNGKNHLALIPLYDMFNHKAGKVTAYYDSVNCTANLESGWNFDPGEEIKMSYGHRSNQELFLYSGFVDESYILNDRVKVWLAIPTSDKLFELRIKCLNGIGLKNSCFISLHYPPVMDRSATLMAFLCIMYMEKSTLEKTIVKGSIEFSTIPSECLQKAFKWLKTYCLVQKTTLDRYKGTSLGQSLARVESELFQLILDDISKLNLQ